MTRLDTFAVAIALAINEQGLLRTTPWEEANLGILGDICKPQSSVPFDPVHQVDLIKMTAELAVEGSLLLEESSLLGTLRGKVEDIDETVNWMDPDDLNAAAERERAARAISGEERALAAVTTYDNPTVAAEDVDPESRPKPGAPSGTVHERLAELGFEANTAADRIDNTPADDWDRTGTVAGTGRTVTALDLARGAVDAGVTHLRAAEEVLHAVRRSG